MRKLLDEIPESSTFQMAVLTSEKERVGRLLVEKEKEKIRRASLQATELHETEPAPVQNRGAALLQFLKNFLGQQSPSPDRANSMN